MFFRKTRKKLISTALLIVLLIGTLLSFNLLFSNLSYNAEAFNSPKKAALDIPSDINFISDDKKAFISFCEQNYGTKATDSIESGSYCYFGSIEGKRLYRMNLSCMPYENLYNETNIGGYTFSSSRLFKQYGVGLYIIDETGVYTLEQAYETGKIDIGRFYELYTEKDAD